MSNYVNNTDGRQGDSKPKTLKFQLFYESFSKIHRLTRRIRKSIARIRICIYFSFKWCMFQLYTTIITNLIMQKKKGLQSLKTNFTCISNGSWSGPIQGPRGPSFVTFSPFKPSLDEYENFKTKISQIGPAVLEF